MFSLLNSWCIILAVKENVRLDLFESFVEGALFLIEVGQRMFGIVGLPKVLVIVVSAFRPVGCIN